MRNDCFYIFSLKYLIHYPKGKKIMQNLCGEYQEEQSHNLQLNNHQAYNVLAKSNELFLVNNAKNIKNVSREKSIIVYV